MSDVIVCGPSSWNQIVYLEDLPQPRPQTVAAEAAYDTLGGTSAGKALHLTDLGRSVELHTEVGDDERGEGSWPPCSGRESRPLSGWFLA